MKDWYVYVWQGKHYTVDLLDGDIVRSAPSTYRDIAQAVLRGKMR